MKALQSGRENVMAVILAGGRDFGRCTLASQRPAPLWPVEGRPTILRLLSYLADSGIHRVVVCGEQNTAMYRDAVDGKTTLDVSFLKEPLPVGTAGCIRDAAGNESSQLLLIFQGAMVSPPPVDWLIITHRAGGAAMTVMLNPPRHGCDTPDCAGIYVCGDEVLGHISKDGYCDIKEGLIPTLWRGGKTVQTATLPRSSGTFRNTEEYLDAVFDYLNDRTITAATSPGFVHERAQVSPSARICDNVVIMENAVICDDVTVIGPAIIEKNVVVESNSLVSQSVLWEGTHVGQNAHMHTCVASYNATVYANSVLEAQALMSERGGMAAVIEAGVISTYEGAQKARYRLQHTIERIPVAANVSMRLGRAGDWLWAGLLSVLFFWLYWPEINQLWELWLRNDEYSSGLIVPLLAVYLIWNRRAKLKQVPKRPFAAGLAVFLAAQVVRFFGLVVWSDSAQRFSLVLSAAAIVLYLFGWQLFRRMAPILLFLLLMLPIPNSIHNKIMMPLQSWATSSAVFSLEMMGFEVVREGNIIHLGDATVAVAETCNGLRMITAFFVISGLMALLVERLWWEKIILFLSALPIGFLCNTLRLTLTALVFTIVKGPFWERMFHNFGGLAMMPLAISAVMAELWILKRLTIAHEHKVEAFFE